MDGIGQRIGATSFRRLLGEWRPVDGRGLAEALAERIRLLVLDGRVPVRTRVPAERELATALAVSRATVAGAYEQLRAADVLRSRRGAGSWTQLPEGRQGTTSLPFAPIAPIPDTALHDLANAALPAPSDAMRSAVAAAAHDLDAMFAGHGYNLAGNGALREAIALRYTERGLPTRPEQIHVTSGAQHAITLVLTVLTAPGDRVLVEHPTYPNTLGSIAARGARAVPVPMTPVYPGGHDWDLDLFTATVRDAAPRLAVVTPDFHNPTGAVLGPADRSRLVDIARRTRTALLVDESLTEIALDGPPPPPVAAHGAADSPLVLTIGSASKSFWGGLRVGWIRSSASMVRRITAARAGHDLGGPALDQLVAARLMEQVEPIVASRRTELAAARDHLLGRLALTFPQWRPSRPPGGLSLWVDLGELVSSRLTAAARRRDVLLAAGPNFGLDGAFERYLRLPYTLRRDRMDAALDGLAAAWTELDHPGLAIETEPVSVA